MREGMGYVTYAHMQLLGKNLIIGLKAKRINIFDHRCFSVSSRSATKCFERERNRQKKTLSRLMKTIFAALMIRSSFEEAR